MKGIGKKLSMIKVLVIVTIISITSVSKAQDMHFSAGIGTFMALGEWGVEDSKLLASEEWNPGYMISGEVYVSDTSFPKMQYGFHLGIGRSTLAESEDSTIFDYPNTDDEYAKTLNISADLTVYEISPMIKYAFTDPNAEGLKIYGELEIGYVYVKREYVGDGYPELSPIDEIGIEKMSKDRSSHNIGIGLGPTFNFKNFVEIVPKIQLLYNIKLDSQSEDNATQSTMLMYPSFRVGVTF